MKGCDDLVSLASWAQEAGGSTSLLCGVSRAEASARGSQVGSEGRALTMTPPSLLAQLMGGMDIGN